MRVYCYKIQYNPKIIYHQWILVRKVCNFVIFDNSQKKRWTNSKEHKVRIHKEILRDRK